MTYRESMNQIVMASIALGYLTKSIIVPVVFNIVGRYWIDK